MSEKRVLAKKYLKGFDIAELSHLTPKQFDDYQRSLLEYAEVKNVSDAAFEEGKIEGEKEKAFAIAKNMLAKHFDLITISELTGLTLDEIAALAREKT